MEESKFNKLNNMYKSLKQLDLDILAKFNCDKITDEDYFLYGILNDIVSNTLNILTNYLTGNIESIGVDNSCRIVLEALTILEMNAKGDISEIQKSIYRYSYAYVDLENFKQIVTKEQLREEQFNQLMADKDKCETYIKRHFGCEDKDINQQENGVDDPCFYLKKKLNDRVSFSKLIDKYFADDKGIGQLYEFFSIMIHPRCEMDMEAEKATMEVHKYYVDNILELAMDYLSKNSLLLIGNKGNDFNDDFFFNPLLAINVINIKGMEQAFNSAIKATCVLPDGFDYFTWFFLEKTKYLVLDMMTSLSLGYTEHIIASFKSFIELFSVYYNINTCSDLTEFNYLKRSYWISSRIQFNEHIKKANVHASNAKYKEELKSIFDNYYASRYNISSFSKFYDKFLHNSLYFLDNSKKSYNKFVREAMEGIARDKLQAKDFFTTYKIANDMAHASGYSFNATADFVRVISHKVVYIALYVIYYNLFNVSLVLSEHKIDVDLSMTLETFRQNMEIQREAIQLVYQNRNSKDN